MSLASQREEARTNAERKIYATRPESPKDGDLWFDSNNNVLRIYVTPIS